MNCYKIYVYDNFLELLQVHYVKANNLFSALSKFHKMHFEISFSSVKKVELHQKECYNV